MEMAYRYGGVVSAELEAAMDACRAIGKVMESVIEHFCYISHDMLDEQLKSILQIAPMFLVFELRSSQTHLAQNIKNKQIVMK